MVINNIHDVFNNCKVAVATLHVGMAGKQDDGYTQWTQL